MKYGNRSPWKRFFYSPVGIVFACIILFFLIRGGLSIHEKAIIAEQRLLQAQTQLTDLQHQQSSLTSSIAQLSTTQGIEAELREKYHAVKQGESVAVIVNDSSTGSSSENATSSLSTKTSWLGSVLRFIGL